MTIRRRLTSTTITCGVAGALLAHALPPAHLVHGRSMVPGLRSGDLVWVDTSAAIESRSYRERVVLARLSGRTDLGKQGLYVKRVVGVAGDTVEMRGAELLVNGRMVCRVRACGRPEPSDYGAAPAWHLRHLLRSRRAYYPTAANWGPVVLPGGSGFLLGDNPRESGDSREWGPVDETDIRGLVSARLPLHLVLFPFAREWGHHVR